MWRACAASANYRLGFQVTDDILDVRGILRRARQNRRKRYRPTEGHLSRGLLACSAPTKSLMNWPTGHRGNCSPMASAPNASAPIAEFLSFAAPKIFSSGGAPHPKERNATQIPRKRLDLLLVERGLARIAPESEAMILRARSPVDAARRKSWSTCRGECGTSKFTAACRNMPAAAASSSKAHWKISRQPAGESLSRRGFLHRRLH